MLVSLIAKDKSGALQIRLDTRDAHVAYLKASPEVQQAGPFLDDDGAMCGSLIILDVDTFEDAQKWADNDPYKHAGLFETVELITWNRVIG